MFWSEMRTDHQSELDHAVSRFKDRGKHTVQVVLSPGDADEVVRVLDEVALERIES